ncbi:MAG: ABC transporter permease [Deltaproteobacteria bacterium]|nr:MAG: ABC transporter permease [Deltaproteobacteria bacterium]
MREQRAIAGSVPRRLAAASLRELGAAVLAVARAAGGMLLLLLESARALVPPRVDALEFVRAAHRFGVESVPIVAVAAFLAGVIVLLQVAVYVRAYGATLLVGWGSGFAGLREIGPVLIALMVSGRAGARNAAELATMRVTEQIDALRAMAIDPVPYLVVPRLLAITGSTVLLTVLGDLFVVAGSALSAWLMVDLRLATFWASFSTYVHPQDFLLGVQKSVFFGLSISLVSCHFGLAARVGATAVGAAVNRAVVGGAASIFLLDYLLTFLLP